MKWKNIFGIVSIVILLNTLMASPVKAEVILDSDFDGLSDTAEVSTYKTDPLNNDTDRDTYADGFEIIHNSSPVNAESVPVLPDTVSLIQNEAPIAWYFGRITGVVAFILLSGVVIFGLIQSSKSLLKFKSLSPVTALVVHRLLAWSGLVSVVLHFSTFFFDDILRLSPWEVFIPFQVHREITTAVGYDFLYPISFGIFGLYAMLILIITSELRNKIVSAKTWRLIHYSTFGGYVLFLIHGFMAGSDSNEVWMRALYISSFSIVLLLTLARIFRKQLFFPKVKLNTPTVVSPVK